MSNRDLYNTWSDFYDSYPNPTVAADDLYVPSFYENVRDAKVLDIGCGTGRHSIRLVQQGCDVTGLDLSDGMLAQAVAKISKSSAAGSFTPVRSDFLSYAETTHVHSEAAAFDFAIMSLALEHFEKVEPVLEAAAKLLRSGGRFLITEIHPARSSQGTLAHFKDPKSNEEFHLEGFSHSETEIRAAALNQGFSVEWVREIVGTDELAAKLPKWARYKDVPMVQAWMLSKGS